MSSIWIRSERSFVQRWLHYLFECPTFWKWERTFTCPDCGKKYRCYWDGNDINGKIHVCNRCVNSEENQRGACYHKH